MNKKISCIVTVVLFSVFLAGYSLWCFLKPTTEFSESERRKLAAMPKIEKDTLLDGSFMKEFETYVVDQLPLRDSLRTVKAITSSYVLRLMDNNKIYVRDGYASKIEFPLREDSITHAANRFSFVYENYVKGNGGNAYLSIIPDKNYFLAEQNGYPTLDYKKLVSSLTEQTDFLTYIDIFDRLSLSDYYKTDTHWRQDKIVSIAEYLAENMGVTFDTEFTTETLANSFYGVYYGQSALPLPPEPLHYLTNDTLSSVEVFDFEINKKIDFYDFERGNGKDPYELFLSGPRSLQTITNENASTEKELIIFRDSFGSSLAPLLCGSYKTITLVDIRYLAPQMLPMLIDFENKDVLFLYSTLVLNNSETIK